MSDTQASGDHSDDHASEFDADAQAKAPDADANAGRKARTGSRLFGRRVALSPTEALQPETAPPPPPRRKRPGLEAFSGFLTFLLIAAAVAALGAAYANRAIRQPGPLTADKAVVIAPGSDTDDIAELLSSQGVIGSTAEFNFALMFEGARSKLKAGEYLFKQGASVQDVIDEIVQGRAILHALTIPEGLTSRQIVERLRAEDALAGDIHDIPREGALLPETYKFQRGDSRDKLLQKMARDQKQLLDEIWRRRAADLPLSSQYDLVTLASIVEKETGKHEERPRVAGVFINRLRKHMRLQSDPTIVYGLVGGQGPLGRPLTRSDIDTPTAYNTYAIDGLPPGPIANPGRAALEAVANPARTHDIYFVADGTGGHVFSESLDAHNRNVQRWRQLEQVNKAKAAAPAAPGLPSDGGPGVVPNAPPARDNRTENLPDELPATNFGAAPAPEDFSVGRLALGPSPPRLARDPSALALMTPLPNAPPPPRQVTELIKPRGPAAAVAFGDTLAEAQFSAATRAENDLDGPASDSAEGNAPPLRRTLAANARGGIDGPADPVEGSAMGSALGYSAGPVNAAPNGKPRIYDASEGTALDPLLNKSWDLNSPKTFDVPTVKNAASSKAQN